MEAQRFLWVNEGDGDNSYAKNSSFQKVIREATRSAMEEAIFQLCGASFSDKLSIADLGCASGPNALSAVADIVNTVEDSCRRLSRPAPEFQLFLNDLPGNDFNSVFRSLQTFQQQGEASGGETGRRRCFVAGVPGTFYGRLFQSKSVHVFHSSSCLHWLSQAPTKLQRDGVPLNKGNIYMPKERSSFVLEAYSTQFQKDFSDFLKFRAEEMVAGGCMVLTLLGRKTWDPIDEVLAFHLILFNQGLMNMVQEGYIAQEKVDSFNLPLYTPHEMEVEREIDREGSFSLRSLKVVEVDWSASEDHDDHIKDSGIPSDEIAKIHANILRAVIESMLTSHFGGDVIDEIFSRFAQVLVNHGTKKQTKVINLVVSLVRKP